MWLYLRVRVRPAVVLQHFGGPLAFKQATVYTIAGQTLSSQWLYMTEKRLKTAQVSLRLEPKLKAAAEKAAAKDHRSLTSLIEKLLSDHLAKLKSAPKPPADDGMREFPDPEDDHRR
jgi:hypothetical protein